VNSKSRIERLEKASGANKQEPPWLVVAYGDNRKSSEEAQVKAKAEYKAKHHDWQEQSFNVIWLLDEDTNRR
jgi:hypothetical protein